MKQIKQKLLLTVALLLSAIYASAYSFEVNGIYYNIVSSSNKTCEVTYKTTDYNSYSGMIVVPSKVIYKYAEYTVTGIGDYAFRDCTSLTYIKIPETVTSIGSYAFWGCKGLISVTIPNSVTTIGNSAFSGCTGLTSVTIASSVTSIGNNAFKNCSGLTKAEFESLESLCKISFSSHDSNPLYYAHNLYIGGKEIKDLVIPNSVTSIGFSAFYGCSALTSVTIPNSVTSIGNYAFYGCSGLTSVTIASSVTSIGNNAFKNCSGLTKAEFESLESLCKISFSSHDSNPLYYAHNLYIGGKEIKDLVIPNSVTSIGASAFYGCSALTSVTIPNSVTSIGSYAFNGCSGLTSVTIPNSVTSIGSQAFYHCSGLTSVTIPNSVTSIGSSAFAGCSGLTSVTIPNSVTSIESYAFAGCSGLTSVTIPSGVTSIGDRAFSGCSGLTSIFWYARKCYDFSYSSYLFPSTVRSVTFGNEVKSIPDYLFYNITALTSVTIPNSVTSIGKYAFYGCKDLKTVVNYSNLNITKGSTEYGYVAYYAVDIISSNQMVRDGDFVYIDSEKTNLVSYMGNAVDVEIPNNVKEIGEDSFAGNTTLTSLRIGSNVQNIGRNAFQGCQNLVKVFIIANTKPMGIENAFDNVEGRQTYVSNSNYDGISALGTINKYSSLSSMFAVNGVKYIPVSMSARTCEALDATYSAEDTEVSIDQTVSYRNVVFKVLSVKPHVLRNNTYVRSLDVNVANIIPDYAFAGCNHLTTVTIGEDVTELATGCFDDNKELRTVNISDGEAALSLPTNAFRSGKLVQLHLGRNLNYTSGNSATSYSPFSSITTLRKVKIGEKVNEIKAFMFRGCTALETAVLNSRLTAIGDYAFAGCRVLNKFTNTSQYTLRITPSVARIGTHAFDDVKDIQNITIETSNTPIEIGSGVFSNSGVRNLYVGRDIKCDASTQPFANCASLEKLEFAKDVTTINEYAYTNTGIKMLTLPEKTAVLSNGTFYKCPNLASVTIPKCVTTIGDNCFGESGLLSVEIGNTVKTIGKSAFENSKQMKYASVAAESIGESAFAGTGLMTADITTQVENIGKAAFSNATDLQTVHIGSASIGEDAFSGCNKLQVAELNERSKSIGVRAFKDCAALTTVNIPIGNTLINEEVFANCSALSELNLPESITAINKSAFNGAGLNSLIIPAAVATIGNTALANTKNLATLVFNASSNAVNVANNAFDGMGVQTLTLNRQFDYNTSSKSPLTDNKTLRIVEMGEQPTSLLYGMFKGCTALQTAKVGESVKTIEESVFEGCSALTTVNVPSGVTILNPRTFYGCSSLASITLPTSVTNISTYVFANSGLQSFEAENTLVQIGLGTFNGCRSLKNFVAKSGSKTLELSNNANNKGLFADCPLEAVNIDRPISYSILPTKGYSPFYRSTTLKSVDMGDYPTSIPANMFYGCSALSDVVVGDGVTTIGEYAFSGCSSINKFYFGGNVTSIGAEAFSDCSAMTELWAQSVTPPTCGNQALDDIDKWSCELYVPAGTVESYQYADQWMEFLFTGENTGKEILPTGVTLGKLNIKLKVDETDKIGASILPSVVTNANIKWKSSNESVATVKDGIVKAVGEGKANIIAYIEGNVAGGGVVSSTCSVEVERLEQELMWVQSFGAKYNGDKFTLTGRADSELPVEYAITGGDNVGNIEGNELTLTGVGTLEITATQMGDSRYAPATPVVRTLTVLPINMTALEIDKEVYVSVGQTLITKTKIFPLNATDQNLEWATMDNDVVSVDEHGVLTGNGTGETYVTATASNGLVARCHVYVNDLGDNHLMIDDQKVKSNEEFTLPIQLNNVDDYTALEFDVELPEVVDIPNVDNANDLIELTDRATNHEVWATVNGNSMHVEIFSNTDQVFEENSGVIANITFNAKSAVSPEMMKLTNVSLYNINREATRPGSVSSMLTIEGSVIKGDVDGDGVVSMADANIIVNIYLGKTISGIDSKMADVNGDGKVTMQDANEVVNVYISK